MIKYLSFFSIVLLLCACQSDKPPALDMSDEDIVALMQDVHIANTLIMKYRTFERDSVSQILRSQMAEIHGISVERIDYIMEQIQLSPAKYLKLEKLAVENLRALKDSLKLGSVVNTKKEKENSKK